MALPDVRNCRTMRWGLVPSLVTVLVGLGGCDAASEGSGPSSSPVRGSAAAPPALGAAGCAPPSPIVGWEVQGTPRRADTQLWGWLMSTDPLPPRVGHELKIVWRMTGSGPLHLTARGPDGVSHSPRWGPEAHTGSNYDRPGDEWGAGYVFGKPGCWQLNATRGSDSADVWLTVSA